MSHYTSATRHTDSGGYHDDIRTRPVYNLGTKSAYQVKNILLKGDVNQTEAMPKGTPIGKITTGADAGKHQVHVSGTTEFVGVLQHELPKNKLFSAAKDYVSKAITKTATDVAGISIYTSGYFDQYKIFDRYTTNAYLLTFSPTLFDDVFGAPTTGAFGAYPSKATSVAPLPSTAAPAGDAQTTYDGNELYFEI